VTSPAISIIIPCRNAASWLPQTLESVFHQRFSDFELLVVDDQSTDESRKILETTDDPRIQILEGPGINASTARNAGLARARGQWIQFLDADDLLHPEKLQIQMELAHNHSEYLLFSGEWARFWTDPAEARFRPEPVWKDLSGLEFLRLHFQEGWMFQPGVWLTHRSLIDKAGSWNEALTLNDDGEFFCRVMLAAGSIHFCAGSKVYYRNQGGHSLSGRRDSHALQSLYDSHDSMLGLMAETDSSPETRQAIADGWKWTAFECYPERPDLTQAALKQCRTFGGSARKLPGGGKFQIARRFLGWKFAKKLFPA